MVQPTSMWWCSDSLPTSTAWIPGVSCGATVVGTWVSAWMCRAHGRRASIWAGNCVILAALLLLASAFGMPQLAVGDVLLGLGVGLIYQVGRTRARTQSALACNGGAHAHHCNVL